MTNERTPVAKIGYTVTPFESELKVGRSKHAVLVPPGTRCCYLEAQNGGRWVVDDLTFIDPKSGVMHDAEHYGIPVPAANIKDEPPLLLTAKENSLRDTVALPQACDWRLLQDNPVVVGELNTVLVLALNYAKASESVTWGMIAEQIYPHFIRINKKYPGHGVLDSEAYQTIARFFAVNYSPALYDFLRFYGAGA